MNAQPEALQLADWLFDNVQHINHAEAAAELRRLHAETTNQQDWLVEWRKCEDELKRLHALNAELLKEMRYIASISNGQVGRVARAAIAKATGENK